MTTSDLITYIGTGGSATLAIANLENVVSIIALIIGALTMVSNFIMKYIEKKKGSE